MIEPPPLNSLDAGSFPFFTMTTRLPGIVRQMLQTGEWRGEPAERLQALEESMPGGKIETIADPLAPDFTAWQSDENSQPPGWVIAKGDLNYRRLLGDLAWEYGTPPGDIVHYLELPVAALRVLKSPVAAGLPVELMHRLQAEEPGWMVNGRWAMIQLLSTGSRID